MTFVSKVDVPCPVCVIEVWLSIILIKNGSKFGRLLLGNSIKTLPSKIGLRIHDWDSRWSCFVFRSRINSITSRIASTDCHCPYERPFTFIGREHSNVEWRLCLFLWPYEVLPGEGWRVERYDRRCIHWLHNKHTVRRTAVRVKSSFLNGHHLLLYGENFL